MRNKPQIAASLPSHVVDAIDTFAKQLELSKGEYLGLIAKKWFAEQCPSVTPEEQALRDLIKKHGLHQPGTAKATLKLGKK